MSGFFVVRATTIVHVDTTTRMKPGSMTKPNRLACITATLLVLAIFVTPAWSAPNKTAYPSVLQDMVDAGELRVLAQFPTSKDGLTGYIVQRGGYQTVVYSEGGYLMLGPLYGPDGKNLSRQYAQQYQPRIIGQVLESLDSDYLITQGPADAPTLYVFADPNCIYCHQLYQRVQPLVKAGRLQIHWIMVGVLGPSSVGRAAAILAAEDPATALAKNESGFQPQAEQGGITPMQTSEQLARVLERHRQAMFSIGGTGTPTIVFSGPQGLWRSRVGVPSEQWLVAYAQQRQE